MTTYSKPRRRVYHKHLITPRHAYCAVPGCQRTEGLAGGVGAWGFWVNGRLRIQNLCQQHGEWLEAVLS